MPGSAITASCIVHPPPTLAADRPAMLGVAPTYGPATLSDLPNAAVIRRRIWVPGLDAGYNPQGLAVAEGSLLISAYRSDSLRRMRGPCRVFRVDPATGRETGHFDVPSPCGHAGGIAYAGDGHPYVADTHTLFEIRLDDAFTPAGPRTRAVPLGPGPIGALAAGESGAVWIGSYDEKSEGAIHRFGVAALAALRDGEALTREMATRRLAIPTYAQGAALAADGRVLWVASSDVDWGLLRAVDVEAGKKLLEYKAPAGIEGIAFDPRGRLWGVSESGARHIDDFPFASLISAFKPILFDIDISLLHAPAE